MDILGDRKFVEVPGTGTHELPPLLVRMAPHVNRLDRRTFLYALVFKIIDALLLLLARS